MNLNDEQKKAVSHFTGPCIVTAVPGSGKTSVLTARVIYLISKRGIDPKNILCTTFTNKAADEMRERITRYVGQTGEQVFVNTFHGLCLAILRKYGNRIGLASEFTVYSEKEQEELLSKVCRMQDYTTDDYGIKNMAKAVNNYREDITPNSFEFYTSDLDSMQIDVILEYEKLLDEFHAVDFSGILFKCWKLLKDSEVTKRLSDRFKFIMVDESQDMNLIQYDICKRLGTHRNLFWVGDYNQSIFSWRSARPEILQQIKHDFEDIAEITLPRNYRSTVQILEAAERLINNNTDTPPVTLISERGNGSSISIQAPGNPEIEAETVANRIHALRRQYKYDWEDFAVLYRINNLSKSVEMAMRSAGIPYRIVGGFSFFDRREIKTALSYFSLVANPFDTISFARAVSEPKRAVGTQAIGKVERYCHDNKLSILEVRPHIDKLGLRKETRDNLASFLDIIQKYRDLQQSMGTSQLSHDLLQESGYIKYITDLSKSDDSAVRRIDNVNELLKSVAEFETKKKKSRLSDYLNNIQILTSNDTEEEKDAVSLLTMHSSKGLEFKVVSVIGCDKSIVPHPRAVAERGEEEERRLMYVAVTRAKDHLFVSYPQTRQRFLPTGRLITIQCEPSKFLFELYPNMPS